MLIRLFAASLIVLLAGCNATATRKGAPALSQVTEVKELARINDALVEAAGKKVLLVLDIDDTLLTSSTFFGSDAWYEWQKHLPEGDPGRVACRFDVIAMNYELGTQRVTEPGAPALINGLDVDTLLLTSRSGMYRAATERELLKAGYALPAMLDERACECDDESGRDSREDGIIYRWMKEAGAKPVTVSYDRGLFMTAGQDKGRMLRNLLERRGIHYDHVILVDDGRPNIDAMKAALADAGVDYHGLWYTRVDKTPFPQEGIDGWAALKDLLRTTFPERLARFEAGDCAY